MCTNPIYAKVVETMSPSGIFKKKLKFLNRDEILELKEKELSLIELNQYVTLPCRKCIECNVQRSKEWALRCSYELREHKKACFLTLTYEKTDGSLNHRDVQLFLKRLRKKIYPLDIRYFGCGEYGSKGKRPHYHMILFGFDFPDKKFYKKSKKNEILWRSRLLEKLWPLGFSSIGNANEQSIKYCTLYLTKTNLIYEKVPHYDFDEFGEAKLLYNEYVSDVKEPYLFMSRKPGIGSKHFLKTYSGATELWLSGRSCSIPQYFLKMVSHDCFMRIKNKRHVIGNFQLFESVEELEKRKILNKKKLQLFGK